MSFKYIVVGYDSVFYTSNQYIDCKNYIDRTRINFPNHIELNIYGLI